MSTPLDHAQAYMRLVASQLHIEISTLEGAARNADRTIEDHNIVLHFEASQRAAIAKLRRNRFHIIKGECT